jgi:phosphoenolpyruvate-protein kinase (PTS system EI component)
MKIVTGIGASSGIAIGKAVRWAKKAQVITVIIAQDEIDREIAQFWFGRLRFSSSLIDAEDDKERY